MIYEQNKSTALLWIVLQLNHWFRVGHAIHQQIFYHSPYINFFGSYKRNVSLTPNPIGRGMDIPGDGPGIGIPCAALY